MINQPSNPGSYGKHDADLGLDHIPGFPAYETYQVSAAEKEKLEKLKEVERNNRYAGVKIGVGYIFGIIAFILPLGLFLIVEFFYLFAVIPPLPENAGSYPEDYRGELPEWSGAVWVLYLLFCVLFLVWAAVRCVVEITKYYSLTSSVGLFLCFITPGFWIVITILNAYVSLAHGAGFLPSFESELF